MLTISAYKLNFRLAIPISISFHTFTHRESILIFLRYGDMTGIGEAAPFKPITGDNQEDVVSELQSLENIPLKPEKDPLPALHEHLDSMIHSQTLKTAIDMGYHDLIGKQRMMPVYGIYSESPVCPDNSVTVFIKDSISDTAFEAQRIYRAYPHIAVLKIKLKGDGMDIGRAAEIKKVSRSHIRYTLDANQAFFNPETAVRELREMRDVLGDVILIEEPCPKGELDKMRFVKEHLEGMLVIADESAATMADVREVIRKGAADGVNIKLQKAGGIYPGILISDLIKKAGLKVMVGSMLEGPLSNSAGAHFAASTQNAIITDLDMDLELPEHSSGGAKFESGKRIPSDAPGLGVTFDFDKLKSLAETGRVIFEQVR